MDGADNGTVFTDQKGNEVTRHGDTVTKTGVKKFGTASAYFDGIGDYLSIHQSAFSLATGNWKVSAHVYLSPNSNINVLLGRWHSVTRRGIVLSVGPSNRPYMTVSTDGTIYFGVDSPTAIPYDEWVFLTFSRVGSRFSISANCVELIAVTRSEDINMPNYEWCIGTNNSPLGDTYFKGYIDNLRIEVGATVTSECVLPTAPFPDSAC
jgi:hypothetical protein